MENPKRPLCAVIGGAKVSSKIDVVRSLLHKCDKILIGGGMAFTFLKAKGLEVGKSLVEQDFISTAEEILRLSEQLRVPLVLPCDSVIAPEVSETAKSSVVS